MIQNEILELKVGFYTLEYKNESKAYVALKMPF